MTIELLIASLPDRENVVAELWLDNLQIAEVNCEGETLCVEFYPPATADGRMFELDELLAALQLAKTKLMGPVR